MKFSFKVSGILLLFVFGAVAFLLNAKRERPNRMRERREERNNQTITNNHQFDVIVLGNGVASNGIYPLSEELIDTLIIGPKGSQLDLKTPVGNFYKHQSGDKFMDGIRDTVERTNSVKHFDAWITAVKQLPSGLFEITTNADKTFYAKVLIIGLGTRPNIPATIKNVKKYLGNQLLFDIEGQEDKFNNAEVIVVGGSDDAFRKASRALKNGAKKVTMLIRSKITAAKFRQQRLEDAVASGQLSFVYGAQPVEIIEKDNKMCALLNNGNSIAFDVMALATGRLPNTELVKHLVDLTENGYIKTYGLSGQTSNPNIFAAGVTDSYLKRGGQALIALSEGMSAAYAAIARLDELAGQK